MPHRSLEHLLKNNRQWAERITAEDPDFFRQLAEQQKPEFLWIGCADSRVPANEIMGLMPGEVFVHRNVANLVVHTDLNCLSVIQFAVEVLKVKHIIVTGHYGCGGVAAALKNQRLGLIDNWLRHIQDIMKLYGKYFDAIDDEATRIARLCEVNVMAQVQSLSETTIVQQAWDEGQKLTIHGWIYGLEDGILKDLGVSHSDNSPMRGKIHNSIKTTLSGGQ
ncbi:carbonic anhydrase [Saccharospirillum sp. MSK14-1]|uniref:carbonate dehydratase n=1 Tax=Saccharospirillum sp. MSK14-1 TaxID=1897632 RepID=UPI000D3BB492|nr:carbonate dehydratase [Saccharospirillum sp. MSK14-1]PTY36966.1 carbonic anhydrase [Saccharospirillum sp. MSK14-1]